MRLPGPAGKVAARHQLRAAPLALRPHRVPVEGQVRVCLAQEVQAILPVPLLRIEKWPHILQPRCYTYTTNQAPTLQPQRLTYQ